MQMPVYATVQVQQALKSAYIFSGNDYPGIPQVDSYHR